MIIPYEALKALALQKRQEHGVTTEELGLQKVRQIYKAEGGHRLLEAACQNPRRVHVRR
jgi:hypothetical protein